MILAAALLLLTASAPSPAPPTRPQRIMSINLCTDLLLLVLAPKSRIASVSHLAHEGVQAFAPGLDAGVAINHGAAEDVAMQKPDLILSGDFTTPVTRALARRTGVPVVEAPEADSLADIHAITRKVAKAVGEPARGEALLAEMDRKLAWLRTHPPIRRYRVVASSGGAIPGRRTLANDIIEAAGGDNIAAKLDSAHYSTFDAEEILAARPDELLFADGVGKDLSLHELGPTNPVIRRTWAQRTIAYPAILFSCGLPQTADAALRLRDAFDRLGRLGAPAAP